MFAVALCHKVGDRANGRFASCELAAIVGRAGTRRLRGGRLTSYIGGPLQKSAGFSPAAYVLRPDSMPPTPLTSRHLRNDLDRRPKRADSESLRRQSESDFRRFRQFLTCRFMTATGVDADPKRRICTLRKVKNTGAGAPAVMRAESNLHVTFPTPPASRRSYEKSITYERRW